QGLLIGGKLTVVARHRFARNGMQPSRPNVVAKRPPGLRDLVLSDAADFSNGSARVFPSNRIVLLLVPPPDEPDLQNYDDWLRLLISHELTHIFHLDRVKGPWGLVQSVLGRVPGTFPNYYQPSWVAEGLATYYESRLTSRGRVFGSFHTRLLTSAAVGNRWLSPGEATYLSPRWPDGIAAYAYGSRFFANVARAAGDSAVPRFIEKTSGQWIPFRTGHPLGAVSGIRRDSLWKSMQREYIERAEVPEGQPEVMASKLRGPATAAVSPGGALAWFEARGDEPAAIVVRRPDGQLKRYRTTANVDLAWSGDTLYATWLELADPFTYRSDLHRLVNGHWTQLTHGARVTDLAAGASGVVAVQVTSTGNRLSILSGDSMLPLTRDPPVTTWASPAMHPSGSLLAVQHESGGYHIVSITRGSTGQAELVSARGNQVLTDPAWSPDGSLLFYVSDESGLPQVHVMNLDGGTLTLTSEAAGATQPVPAHDGWLYFTALESDGYALKRIRWDPKGLATRLDDAPITAGSLTPGPMVVSAPVRVRTGGYAPWAALRPHYFVPLVLDKGSAGTFIGGLTSGSDPVGRVGYGLQLGVGTKGARLDGVLSLVYQRWAHHAVDVYLSQDWGDAGRITSPIKATARSRERDAELGVSNLWGGWYRSLALRVAGHYEEDHFESSPMLAFINPAFAGVSVSLGSGTLERPPLAISSEDGITLSARYRRRWRLDTSGWSEDWRGRIAVYEAIKGIGLFAHPVLAGRVGLATSSGPDRESYGVGGPSGIGYQPLPGIVVGSGRQFPVRGYQPGETRGGTAMVGTAEFRLPIALVAKPLGSLPYGLDRLSLDFFYDYGRVWRASRAGLPRDISSTGVELTWDLSVLYDVPLRIRTGLAVPLQDGSRTKRGKVAFGIAFGSDF
ncbi:MAG TPA: hypothetical protein VGP80_13510, partial [Gemmatimonadales bacterium]|nr:hypothetical protein [Gemmatimonadales bacterium]